MAAIYLRGEVAPDNLRLTLLAYGINHAYRVVTLEEIAQAMPQVRREDLRAGLDRLTEEGLVTRFSGRFCFNKTIPRDLRHTIERRLTSSGTIRMNKQA